MSDPRGVICACRHVNWVPANAKGPVRCGKCKRELTGAAGGSYKSLATGQPIKLGRLISEGAEGKVYKADRPARTAFKLWLKPAAHAPNEARDRLDKLRVMIANPPEDRTRSQNHVTLAWPTELVADRSGAVVGFLMPLIDPGMVEIHSIYNTLDRAQHAPGFTYGHLLHVALNMAICVDDIHSVGHVVGDLQHRNLLVHPAGPKASLVSVVDCDSMQIVDAKTGRTFRCPVGLPEYMAPELQRKLGAGERTFETDRFALAVLVYQLLMAGFHPLSGRWHGAGEPTVAERIALTTYAHGGARELTPPVHGLPIDVLPSRLRSLFGQCFVDGATRPKARPTAAQWCEALTEAEGHLTTCKVNGLHEYSSHLKACPWCARTRAGKPELFGGRSASRTAHKSAPRQTPRPTRAVPPPTPPPTKTKTKTTGPTPTAPPTGRSRAFDRRLPWALATAAAAPAVAYPLAYGSVVPALACLLFIGGGVTRAVKRLPRSGATNLVALPFRLLSPIVRVLWDAAATVVGAAFFAVPTLVVAAGAIAGSAYAAALLGSAPVTPDAYLGHVVSMAPRFVVSVPALFLIRRYLARADKGKTSLLTIRLLAPLKRPGGPSLGKISLVCAGVVTFFAVLMAPHTWYPYRTFREASNHHPVVRAADVMTRALQIDYALYRATGGRGSPAVEGEMLAATSVRKAPRAGAAPVGALSAGQRVTIVCTTVGDAVEGPKAGNATLWDRLVWPDGFMPDSAFGNGTTRRAAPECGTRFAGPFQAKAADEGVFVRSNPSAKADQTGGFGANEPITIRCAERGEKITGATGTTDIWNYTDEYPRYGYTSDAYVVSPPDTPVAPRC